MLSSLGPHHLVEEAVRTQQENNMEPGNKNWNLTIYTCKYAPTQLLHFAWIVHGLIEAQAGDASA